MTKKPNTEWATIERPGYFSKKRDELRVKWNEEYGEGGWRITWQWGSRVIERPEALQIYEDGYYEFLKTEEGRRVLLWLAHTASDVYDTAQSNIEAGLSYDEQETPNNHLHDVAIRRVVLRLGVILHGDHLVQVRGRGTEGELLSPHMVPFHRRELILDDNGEVKDYGGKGKWWREIGRLYSVEEFYQHNKLLQALREND